MTPAQKQRLAGFNASLKARGVSITVTPGDMECLALIEVVDEQTRKRLQISDDLITHVVHIRRDDLAGVQFDSVAEIERADSAQTYRVQHFKDDPQRPAVLLFSILS